MKSLDYGTDYTPFVKISDRFENYKFFNPDLTKKYFGDIPNRPSVIPDGFKKEKSKNTYRIFALGGSTTAGFPHPPNGSFPRLLKQFLAWNYPQIDFEVINLGVSAINSITIRDIIDDVIEESPDLIIIYAGHNEYYGALGPSSNVAGFYSLPLTRLILNLKRYRTVQFLENIMSSVGSIFIEKPLENKTLMSEMAGQNLIPINSEEFLDGADQFEANLDYILNRCNEKNVQVLIGTLASNLMQSPLCKYSGCDKLSSEFDNVFSQQNIERKSKLYNVKDGDELRFRAPEKFNQIIKNQTQKYSFAYCDVQKTFEENSPEEIIGYNLMLDHLHPTFYGNKLIAELLFNSIIERGFLDQFKSESSTYRKSSSRFPSQFAYSSLDSSYAMQKISYLMNMYPFTPSMTASIIPLSKQKSLIDSLAWKIVNGITTWEEAHLNLAKFHLNRNEFEKFIEEITILIEDKPFDKYPYLEAIKSLEKVEQDGLTKYILHKYYKIYPDLFASRKLADLYFGEKNHRNAIYFYEKCLDYANNDPQIYFNLSASYYGMKDLTSAIKNISKCLDLNQNFPNARKIYNGLLEVYNRK